MVSRVLIFFILSCFISWLCWLPILNQIASSPFESSPTVILLFFLGAYAPSLVGISLSYFYDKKNGLKSIRERLKLKKLGIWTLVSLMAGPVIYGLALLSYAVFGGQLGNTNVGLYPWIPVVFLVSIVLGPLAEEFGWRGFALPHLSPNIKPIYASLVVGMMWAAWHIPLFWAKSGTAISGFQPTISLILLFFAAVIISSFIYTFLFNKTNGNISLAILLHLSMNASGTIRGMLFPDMNIDQSLIYYKHYVVVLGLLVLAGYLVYSFAQNKKLKTLKYNTL